MEVEVGLGGSTINVQLGSMLTVSTPPNAFMTADDEMYEGQVVFRGGVVDINDEAALNTLPSASFFVTDDNGEETPFSMLMAMVMRFEDPFGLPLQLSKDLTISVSVPTDSEDGLWLLGYDPMSGTWNRTSSFSPVQQSRKKRQSSNPAIVFDTQCKLRLDWDQGGLPCRCYMMYCW